MFRAAWSILSNHNRLFGKAFLVKTFGSKIERFYGTHNIHRNYVVYKSIYWKQAEAAGFKRHLRTFQTSPHNHALPTWMILTYGQLPTILTVSFGRFLKWKWNDFPLRTTSQLRELLIAKKHFLLILLLLALSSTMFIYISGLQKDPITHRRKFIALNKKQIEELAERQYKDESPILHLLTVPNSDSRYRRLSRVFKSLLDANRDIQSIREKNWNVYLINAPYYVNALAFHNGTVFVFSGTLKICSKDDQLAFVLAHEIAHVLLHHMPELHSRVHLMDFVLILPLVLIWALLSFKAALISHFLLTYLTDLAVHYPFIRRLEYEADEVGLNLIAKACFDVREASVFWHKIHSLLAMDDGKPVEWISTHPGTRARRQHLDEHMPKAVDLRKINKCPNLPNKDPRIIITDSYKKDNDKKG